MSEKILNWWNGRSVFFSGICGEEFTRGEVILTHLTIIVLLTAAIIAGA